MNDPATEQIKLQAEMDNIDLQSILQKKPKVCEIVDPQEALLCDSCQ